MTPLDAMVLALCLAGAACVPAAVDWARQPKRERETRLRASQAHLWDMAGAFDEEITSGKLSAAGIEEQYRQLGEYAIELRRMSDREAGRSA